ncbi:MAG: 2-oxoacid:acceptor oxidoreductase subunit alpha [Nitrospirae bacterium CG_4_9_14_3_um_filter_53_35]|nr:MAG: pyruvate ferredoxin oxidoreductase [Nitrospirae bacterium CG2_30_53_67]PIS37511.1 MAG: 2-oxoacid:acceptor oxidoreductase subunit alpha [Nitrospirae bacterium CG08_land_8_20_14_0_20_52_24]PIW84295.1 MAG: 2-oxoacid:acceptor oxidoreductase subunit alpha [Nitrospirae bacterium CG_4_8_14_3_um_filter_50_41]PJA76657.1 MAG: 2-oxoacid:acceptor oxidoreductase subunit alpha [Nitrospirae bacterium CG_4_9_14_3_um_filter_53_35]
MPTRKTSQALNILIGGEAGQGLVTIGELLSRSLVRSGYSIVVTQDYQSRIRGGHNTFAVRVSAGEIYAPQESVDLLIALNQETVRLHRDEVSPQGLMAADQEFDVPENRCLAVPYKDLSLPRYSNVAALGIAGFLLGLEEDLIARLLDDLFGKKDPNLAEQNRKVLSSAFRWSAGQKTSFQKLPKVSNPPKRLMLNANDAIALGALSAGVRFCAFYPMTPSTSISLSLAASAEKMGLIVEQAEDEIAAVNMAIGASFAGAPSMTATSGGGFALMVEGVSLAAMTETPVVIVVGQRPGPATGLPTRTEQADLEFVLHAGHGEFPKAIFAPANVEDGFYLTRKAFELAERYQGPVFILTDQFLSDSYRAVAPFDIGNLPQVHAGADPVSVNEPYKRYALTETGISPRLLPGRSRHLVMVDSDEHTEEGHITEDLSIRTRMVQKRQNKLNGLRGEVTPPVCEGDDRPDLLLVSWGSTMGSVLEAASKLREEMRRVATLHFSQVWPMAPDQFIGYLQEAREVVCVEGNATGQLARLIRRETGFEIKRKILRYDGLPITPEWILRELNRAS